MLNGQWVHQDTAIALVNAAETQQAAQAATVDNAIWAGAESKGNYKLLDDDLTRVIYPTNKHGESIRVTIPKFTMTLKHKTTGDEVTFTRNKAQGRWFYHDDRLPKAVSRFDVVASVQRMLKVGPHEASAIVKARLHE